MKELGEVRAILARGVSSETFDALCAFYPEGEMPDEVVDYLLGHLQRWPDEVRRRVPDGWMRQVEGGNVCRAVRLCNALWIEGHRALMQRLNRWLRCEEVGHIRELVIDSRGRRYQLPDRLLHAEHFTGLETFGARGVGLWSRKELEGLREGRLLHNVRTLRLDRVHDREGALRQVFEHAQGLERVSVKSLSGDVESLLPLFEREVAPASVVFDVHPMLANTLRDAWFKVAREGRGLDRVRELGLVGVRMEERELEAFFCALTHLERLDLRDAGLSDAGVDAVCEGLRRAPLRSLGLGSRQLSVEALTRALSRPWMLEELQITSMNTSPNVAEVVSDAPYVSTLRRLELSHNQLEDEACEALASSPWLDGLERLSLRGNRITDKGAHTLFSASFAEHLLELDLEENVIELLATQQQLWRLPKIEVVKEILLSSAVLDDVLWEEIFASPCAASTEYLRFEQVSWQRAQGFERCLEGGDAGAFRRLRVLEFDHGEVSGEAVEALSGWPALAHVHTLQMRSIFTKHVHRPAWSEALERLLSAERLRHVQALDLSENDFGASREAVEALLNGLGAWRGDGLRWLSLEGCQLTGRDQRRLAKLSVMKTLSVLVLRGNAYDYGALEHLEERLRGVRIVHEAPYEETMFMERGMVIEREPEEHELGRAYWGEWEI